MCMFCRSLFVLLSFSIGHCVVCPSVCGFWLPLWYLQTLLTVYTNQYRCCIWLISTLIFIRLLYHYIDRRIYRLKIKYLQISTKQQHFELDQSLWKLLWNLWIINLESNCVGVVIAYHCRLSVGHINFEGQALVNKCSQTCLMWSSKRTLK